MKRAQVAVVGGGSAGANAAIVAAHHGAKTILIDEQSGKTLPNVATKTGAELKEASLVWGLFADNVLGIVNGESSYRFQSDQVILATGSTDLPYPFPGGSLPGVFTSRAVRIMLREWGVMPGNRFVVIGDGVDADEITTDIERFGGQILTRVLMSESPRLSAIGHQGVESVEVEGFRYDAEIVVVAVGRQPDIELALMAECATGYCEALGGFVPIRDENLRTSVPSILVAGDAAGICDSIVAVAEGRFAGISAAHALGLVDDSVLEEERTRYLEVAGERATLGAQLSPAYVQV